MHTKDYLLLLCYTTLLYFFYRRTTHTHKTESSCVQNVHIPRLQELLPLATCSLWESSFEVTGSSNSSWNEFVVNRAAVGLLCCALHEQPTLSVAAAAGSRKVLPRVLRSVLGQFTCPVGNKLAKFPIKLTWHYLVYVGIIEGYFKHL